ncbi:MAG: hypothetical protein JNM56_34530 [Planctomycetia bacterium]|nr:hypothetical protein [Planctomycetia bacterium]
MKKSLQRCCLCGDRFVADPSNGAVFTHESNPNCAGQPSDDPTPAVCCRVLAAFGYLATDCKRLLEKGGWNPCAKPDASNLQKLSDLILETPYGMSMDWRGDPTDSFLKPLARIAAEFDVRIEVKQDEVDLDAVMLWVETDGHWRQVAGTIGPADEVLTSLAELGQDVEEASGGLLVTRVVRIYEPSDTWGYVTLSPERWRTVKKAAGKHFEKLFLTGAVEDW